MSKDNKVVCNACGTAVGYNYSKCPACGEPPEERHGPAEAMTWKDLPAISILSIVFYFCVSAIILCAALLDVMRDAVFPSIVIGVTIAASVITLVNRRSWQKSYRWLHIQQMTLHMIYLPAIIAILLTLDLAHSGGPWAGVGEFLIGAGIGLLFALTTLILTIPVIITLCRKPVGNAWTVLLITEAIFIIVLVLSFFSTG